MQKQLKSSRSLLNDLVGFWRASLLGPPILGFMAISLLAQPVGAQPTPPLEFLFDEAVYDGAANQPPDPLSGDYWLRAIISEVDSDTVGISLKANLKAIPEAFIESVAFNLDPFVVGTNLQCAAAPGICTGAPSANPGPSEWGFNFDEDGVNLPNQADGFDFEILLPRANSADRLTGSEEFNITVDGLSVAAFNATNSGKPNSLTGLFSAAKIQGYGGSATLLGSPGPDPGPTPVPGPLPIVGAAAAFQASRRLRSRLKSVAVAARPA
jgi:hypothetical protein